MSPMLSSGFPCSRSLFNTTHVLHINAAMLQMHISEWQPVAVICVTLCASFDFESLTAVVRIIPKTTHAIAVDVP